MEFPVSHQFLVGFVTHFIEVILEFRKFVGLRRDNEFVGFCWRIVLRKLLVGVSQKVDGYKHRSDAIAEAGNACVYQHGFFEGIAQ